MGQKLIDCADDAAFMLAQRIARLESERDMRFNNCLFGNTPWKLVLELYIAKNGLSRADLLQRVSSPSSTSGRYLKALEHKKASLTYRMPNRMRRLRFRRVLRARLTCCLRRPMRNICRSD
jgi:hypothetical protein